jgi:hypothetical protein
MAEARAVVADLTALDRTALETLVLAQQEKLLSRDSEIEQLELKLEELEARRAERTAATTSDIPEKNKPTRRPLPEHLPREVHTNLPQDKACFQCGGELCKLGENVSEMLEYIPASFKVIRHVRPKLSCTKCDVIIEAPCTAATNRSQTCRAGAAGACAGVEVCRPLSSLSPVGDLRSRGHRS